MYIRDTINQTYKILGDKADGIFSRCIYGLDNPAKNHKGELYETYQYVTA